MCSSPHISEAVEFSGRATDFALSAPALTLPVHSAVNEYRLSSWGKSGQKGAGHPTALSRGLVTHVTLLTVAKTSWRIRHNYLLTYIHVMPRN